MPVPAGSRTIFTGCYEPADTRCVDKVLPAQEDGRIDCEDDVTDLAAKVAPPGQGPQIDNVTGRKSLSPTSTCQGGACTVAFLAAGELTASTPALLTAGAALATLAWVGGALLLAVAVYNTVKSIFLGEPTAILGILEYNIDYRTDFTTYEEWYDQKGLYYNSLQIYAQIITATRQFATNATPFAWNDSTDADLRRTIDQACNAQQKLSSTSTSTGCGNGFAIYVPGATSVSKNGLRLMPQTGKHITETIYPTVGLDHPERVPWFYPARSAKHRALTGAGFSAAWYDAPPFVPNECTGRVLQACDEFPFKSTNQAANLSGARASLRPVPNNEASVQGTDISSFYRKCEVDDNDEFLIIPIPSWVAAGGPSFGFRVGDDNATEMCHGPGV
ncbi:NucA/NucB deoxyribonuclease domain-containing protein [Spongisporangium articulatum]|uniref:NucA/NucB deoxyribonuclease domain-containing protein n=1 Tax=Spongisporangium articulatum TaxID=3362603 RepID=A0ABW8AQX0_9ACTN